MDQRDARRVRLQERLEAALDHVACTIVSLEEMLRGWLAAIHRRREVVLQVAPYTRLAQLFETMVDWDIIPFNQAAAEQFASLLVNGAAPARVS